MTTKSIKANRCYLHASGQVTCILREPQDLAGPNYLQTFAQENNVDIIFGIHAYRSGVILRECDVPYVIIFGGTDVNEMSSDPSKLEVMSDVLRDSRCAICFNSPMLEKALEIWPNMDPDNIKEIPQAVVTSPSKLMFHAYLKEKFNVDATNVFTLVGGIRPVKDPLFLVLAFSDWHLKTSPCSYFVVIGFEMDETFTSKFKSVISRTPGVLHIPGMSLEDTHAAIQQSTALVNSSISEGMAAAILESFIQCAEQLLSSSKLRETLTRNARDMIRSRHSPISESLAYQSVITQVLSASQHSDRDTDKTSRN